MMKINTINFKRTLLVALPILMISCDFLNGPRPKDLGIGMRDNKGRKVFALAPCPEKPICVSSYEFQNGTRNFLEGITYKEPEELAYEKILKIALNYPKEKTRLVSKTDSYIHFEFTWSPFSITDDVEFFFGEGGVVNFRSSSRALPYDFGVNKRRIEDIRFRFFQNDY